MTSTATRSTHPLLRLDNQLDITDCEIIDNDYQTKYRPLLVEYLKDKGRIKLSDHEIQTILHIELFDYEAEFLVSHPSTWLDIDDPDCFDENGEYEGGVDIASAECLLQTYVQHLAHREFYNCMALLEDKFPDKFLGFVESQLKMMDEYALLACSSSPRRPHRPAQGFGTS
jgi:hypothetical protein